MAATSQPMIWASTTDFIKALPLTKAFEPCYQWDNDARAFTDEQEVTADGKKVWQSEALLHMGYGRQLTPVRVRIATNKTPEFAPDPAVLAAALGVSAGRA